jgi:hypothetical protein
LSYYNLFQEEALEGIKPGDYHYFAPLGVDTRVFHPKPHLGKPFRLGMSGYVADAECLTECAAALAANHVQGFHLGHDLTLGNHVRWAINLADQAVAAHWSMCDYVAGLRRVEGFELPVYEGLACGSRPVVFDRPHYRGWLGEHAVYITESDPAQVTEELTRVLSHPPVPVKAAEIAWAKETFDWETIVAGFWERVL